MLSANDEESNTGASVESWQVDPADEFFAPNTRTGLRVLDGNALDNINKDSGMTATANFTRLMGRIRFLTDSQRHSKKRSRQLTHNYFPRQQLHDANRHRIRSRTARHSMVHKHDTVGTIVKLTYRINESAGDLPPHKIRKQSQIQNVFKALMTSMVDRHGNDSVQKQNPKQLVGVSNNQHEVEQQQHQESGILLSRKPQPPPASDKPRHHTRGSFTVHTQRRLAKRFTDKDNNSPPSKRQGYPETYRLARFRILEKRKHQKELAERELNAALMVQRMYRRYITAVSFTRTQEVLSFQFKLKHVRAIARVQAATRRFLARKRYMELSSKRNIMARRLQRHFRIVHKWGKWKAEQTKEKERYEAELENTRKIHREWGLRMEQRRAVETHDLAVALQRLQIRVDEYQNNTPIAGAGEYRTTQLPLGVSTSQQGEGKKKHNIKFAANAVHAARRFCKATEPNKKKSLVGIVGRIQRTQEPVAETADKRSRDATLRSRRHPQPQMEVESSAATQMVPDSVICATEGFKRTERLMQHICQVGSKLERTQSEENERATQNEGCVLWMFREPDNNINNGTRPLSLQEYAQQQQRQNQKQQHQGSRMKIERATLEQDGKVSLKPAPGGAFKTRAKMQFTGAADGNMKREEVREAKVAGNVIALSSSSPSRDHNKRLKTQKMKEREAQLNLELQHDLEGLRTALRGLYNNE